MVIDCLYTFEKKTNYFMTTDEVTLMWKHINKHYSLKWPTLFGFCAFRGMRIGEGVAVNIFDFMGNEYDRLNIVLQKSYIKDVFPMIKGFSKHIEEYIRLNNHTFKDGFIFPYYSRKSSSHTHMTMETAEAYMSKWRNSLGKEYPDFLECHKIPELNYLVLKIIKQKPNITPPELCKALCRFRQSIARSIQWHMNKGYLGHKGITEQGEEWLKDPKYTNRYRIGFHSLRRWFETQLYDAGVKPIDIADIMRYRDRNTPLTYLDPYSVWKKEPQVLEQTFGKIWDNMQMIKKGQTRLSNW